MVKGRKRKGQYLTLENIFFFSIGLAMALTVFFAFSNISENVRTGSYQKQLLKAGELMRENVVRVFSVGNQTNSSVQLTIKIPRDAAGCIYKITAGAKLNLLCTVNDISTSLSLYGIDAKIKFDTIYSSQEYVKISYENGKIILE